MTKRERELVRRSISDIMDERGDFMRGIGTLCKLIGMRYVPWEVLSREDVKAVDIRTLLSGQNRKSTFTEL